MDRKVFISEVFDGQRHDRLPRALFGSGLWAYRQVGFKPEEIIRKEGEFIDSLSELYGQLDTDMLFLGSGLNSFPAEAIGGVLGFRGEQAPLLQRPLIQSEGDLLNIKNIDLQNSAYTQALVHVIEGVRRNLPDRFICATSWGPFAWAMILCDWEFLKEKLRSDKQFVIDVSELGARLSTSFFDLLIGRNLIDGVSVPDGAVTLLPVSSYEELVLPLEKRLFDHAEKRQVRRILHMCGEIRPQLELYPHTGAECISVDNHVTMGEAYALYRNVAVSAGNVDVVSVIEKGDEAHINTAVTACIDQIPDWHRNFILMPSCDLPVNTPRRNVEVFLSGAERVSNGTHS